LLLPSPLLPVLLNHPNPRCPIACPEPVEGSDSFTSNVGLRRWTQARFVCMCGLRRERTSNFPKPGCANHHQAGCPTLSRTCDRVGYRLRKQTTALPQPTHKPRMPHISILRCGNVDLSRQLLPLPLALAHSSLLIAGSQIAFALPQPPGPLLSRIHPRSCFRLCLSSRPSSKPPSLQANPHPQTIFHAFTQQNRMSSPQTPPKTHNINPINNIKVSQKWFLVMVNPVQLT
jgi:hypothetical protein